MSRPKFWWYGFIKKAIAKSPTYKDRNESEYKAFTEAIAAARADFEKKQDGDKMLQAIDEVIIKKRQYEEVAARNFYSERTVRSWVGEYVRTVGKYKGFDQ